MPPSKSTTLILVRHGVTATTGSILPGRARGLHLSEEGHAQAANAGARCATLGNIAALYCSPLERTKETAKAIGTACGLTPKVDRGLVECDFGTWTGKKLSVLSKKREWAIIQQTPSLFTFPGGESFLDMQVRMIDSIHRHVANHAGETIVIVSHADPIKAYLCHVLGMHMDMFQRITIAPCSLSIVLAQPHTNMVLSVNNVGDHLAELVPS